MPSQPDFNMDFDFILDPNRPTAVQVVQYMLGCLRRCPNFNPVGMQRITLKVAPWLKGPLRRLGRAGLTRQVNLIAGRSRYSLWSLMELGGPGDVELHLFKSLERRDPALAAARAIISAICGAQVLTTLSDEDADMSHKGTSPSKDSASTPVTFVDDPDFIVEYVDDFRKELETIDTQGRLHIALDYSAAQTLVRLMGVNGKERCQGDLQTAVLLSRVANPVWVTTERDGEHFLTRYEMALRDGILRSCSGRGNYHLNPREWKVLDKSRALVETAKADLEKFITSHTG